MKISENGVIALVSSAVLLFSGIIYLVSADETSDNRIIITPNGSEKIESYDEVTDAGTKSIKDTKATKTEKTTSSKLRKTTTTVSKSAEVAASGKTETSYTFPADINKADNDMLCAVPGIGDTLAGNILSYKSQHGDFKSMYELLNVDGIGEGKLGILMRYFYVVNDVGSQPAETAQSSQRSYTQGSRKTTSRSSTTSGSVHTTSTGFVKSPSVITEPQPTAPVRRRVNINRADADEIRESLLIDEELAAEIVEIRELIGGYTNIREVLMADGFSQELLVELDEYIEI